MTRPLLSSFALARFRRPSRRVAPQPRLPWINNNLGSNEPSPLLRFPLTQSRAPTRSRVKAAGQWLDGTRRREQVFLRHLHALRLPVVVQGPYLLQQMGMKYLDSANPSSGTTDEMKKLQGLSAETMMEPCQSIESKDVPIRCPIPCKSSRWYREHDFKAVQDLSDFIVSKASPPYFMGSPPVRATNPLVHDTQFCAWKVQSVDQSAGVPIPSMCYNACYGVKKGSVTKA